MPTGRTYYFLQSCTLSNSLSISASCVCLPRSLGEVLWGSPLQGSPRALTIPSTPQAPSPPCLSLPACPRGHPGKFSHGSLPWMSQALPSFCTISHNSHASTKIKERVFSLAAFLGYLFKRKMTYIDEKLASKHINQMPSITGLPVLK